MGIIRGQLRCVQCLDYHIYDNNNKICNFEYYKLFQNNCLTGYYYEEDEFHCVTCIYSLYYPSFNGCFDQKNYAYCLNQYEGNLKLNFTAILVLEQFQFP